MNIYISLIITMLFLRFLFGNGDCICLGRQTAFLKWNAKGALLPRILSIFFQEPERVYLYHVGG